MKTITAFLCALALSPVLALGADYPEISHDELKKAIEEKKVTLLDVNGSDSWKGGHIPGAVDFTTAKKDLSAKLRATRTRSSLPTAAMKTAVRMPLARRPLKSSAITM
jgi:rhodanese-related sulfurtransferase